MKRVLTIVAHPDDEILWCWPVMQSDDYEKGVLCVTDNSQSYGERATKSLFDVAQSEGWFAECGNIESGFSRLPIRYVEITLVKQAEYIRHLIDRAIDEFCPDIIFTHNPVGEYSHTDHKLLFELVCTSSQKPVWFSDICLENKCHVSYQTLPDYIFKAFYQRRLFQSLLNTEWYERCRDIYKKNRAWSWGNPIVTSCSVYELGR